MMDDKSFRDLFDQALRMHRQEFSVNDNAIGKAIEVIHQEYSVKEWKGCSTSEPVNYNDPAYRCAYLHKYASCHAALVRKALLTMLSTDTPILWNNVDSYDCISICCLGGGPGTDVIGLSSVFCLLDYYRHISYFDFTVVDCMADWYFALVSVLRAASSGQFGSLAPFVSNCNCRYLQADLLVSIPDLVIKAVGSADMITMVKFVSAAACDVTPNMLKIVFTSLKPGALVFFIDNAAGGFYEMVSAAAYMYGLSTESGPFRHMKFENEVFKRKLFGFFSLSSTTVAVQMWRKTSTVFWNSKESVLTSQTGFHSAENISINSQINYGNAFTKKKSGSRSANRKDITDKLSAKKLADASKGESFSNASQNRHYCTKTQNHFSDAPLTKERAPRISIWSQQRRDLTRKIHHSSHDKTERGISKSMSANAWSNSSASQRQCDDLDTTPLLKDRIPQSKGSSLKISRKGDRNKQQSMYAKPCHSNQNLNSSLLRPSISSCRYTGSEVTPLIKENTSSTSIKNTSYKGDSMGNKQQSTYANPNHSNQNLNSSLFCPSISSWQCTGSEVTPLIKKETSPTSINTHGVVVHNDLKSHISSRNPKVRGKENNVHNVRTRSPLPVDVTPHQSGVTETPQASGARKTTNTKFGEIMSSCCCAIS